MVSVTAFWPRRRAVVCRHRTSGCSPAVMASLGTLPSARGRAGRPAGLPALPRTSATSCRLDRDMVEERRQTFPWLPAYELPYPFGRLWRAFPALRPARALASRIPLGLGPWLHRLRRDPSPLVRRLHSYYDRVRFLHAVHHRLRISSFPQRPRPRQRDGMETSQVPVQRVRTCLGSSTPRDSGPPRHSGGTDAAFGLDKDLGIPDVPSFRCSIALPARAPVNA